jgi:hypothetical protein
MLDRLLGWLGGRLWEYAGLALIVLFFFAGAAAGWAITGLSYKVQLAGLQKTHAEAMARAAGDALIRLAAAQKRADDLTAQLAAASAARKKITLEKNREIKRLTTGRPCLGAGVIGLLNDAAVSAPGLRLPPAAGLAFNADAGFAADTDVALWARDARDRHDACRERIDALRAWFDQGSEARDQASTPIGFAFDP